MHAIWRIIALFLVFVAVSSCSTMQEYYMKKSLDLSEELAKIEIYIANESQKAEDRNDEERFAELYDAADELEKECALLHEAGYKKFFGEVLSFGLKLVTINSLPTCGDKVREMQERFPDYKKDDPKF